MAFVLLGPPTRIAILARIFGAAVAPGHLVPTIDSRFFAMNTIFNDVCAIVTAAFTLTLVPGFRRPARSLLSRRDQETTLLVFMSLGLLEEATASHARLA